MKTRSLPLLLAAAVCLAACGNDKTDPKPATPAADSSVVRTDLPPADTAGFAAPPSIADADRPVSLKFNLQKGKRYDYDMVFDVTNEKEERKFTNLMNWSYSIDVLDENKGIKTVKTTYRTMAMSMDMGTTKVEFSSEKKVAENDLFQLPSRMFGIIKGKSFMMKINDKGEILEVTGFDKIAEDMIRELNVPAEQKEMMEKNFRQQFSDKSVKEMFSQAFEIFPEKQVKPGDSWSRKASMGPSGGNTSTNFTLRNIKNGKAYIDLSSKMGDTGSQAGKMIVDIATGLVLDVSTNYKIKKENGSASGKSRITGKAS